MHGARRAASCWSRRRPSENEGTTGFPQIVTAEKYVLRHHLGQVISQSFAATEQTFPSRSRSAARLRGAYQLAARDHVTGAGCDRRQRRDGLQVQHEGPVHHAAPCPGRPPIRWSPPSAARSLTCAPTAPAGQPDVAWTDSGGGRSLVFARPSYQNGVRAITGARRGVPDISMDASCASSVSIYASFHGGGGPWSTICGTSLATPLFAGHGRARRPGRRAPLARPDQPGDLHRSAAPARAGHRRHPHGQQHRRRSARTASSTRSGASPPGRGYDLVTGVGTVERRVLRARAGQARWLGRADSAQLTDPAAS